MQGRGPDLTGLQRGPDLKGPRRGPDPKGVLVEALNFSKGPLRWPLLPACNRRPSTGSLRASLQPTQRGPEGAPTPKGSSNFEIHHFFPLLLIFTKKYLGQKSFLGLLAKKTQIWSFFDEKTPVVLKKPQFLMKKPQNPSHSRKTPDLVKKTQEWERWFG